MAAGGDIYISVAAGGDIYICGSGRGYVYLWQQERLLHYKYVCVCVQEALSYECMRP
jgi:hypothetical protein